MILVIICILIFVLVYNEPEKFDYRSTLISEAHVNNCLPGYILSNCKQTTPKITTTLDSISTICKCSMAMNDVGRTNRNDGSELSYNIQINS